MTQYTYTHIADDKGKMVEKANRLRPVVPLIRTKIAMVNYIVANREYKEHIAKLTTYPTLGFSPSENGKTFNDNEFRLKECGWSSHGVDPDMLIAVPLSEKREDRTQDELWDSFGKIMDEIFCDGGFAYARTRIEPIIRTLKREGYSITKTK